MGKTRLKPFAGINEAFARVPASLCTARAKTGAKAIHKILTDFANNTDALDPGAIDVLAAGIAAELERERLWK